MEQMNTDMEKRERRELQILNKLHTEKHYSASYINLVPNDPEELIQEEEQIVQEKSIPQNDLLKSQFCFENMSSSSI